MARVFKIFLGIFTLSVVLMGCGDALGDRYVGFAKCLRSNGAQMYGAYWCPHCAEQKEMFGAAGARELGYVECDPRGKNPQPQLCKTKNVTGFPTWEFADGSMVQGTQPLQTLADKTKCELPPEEIQ